MEYWIIGIASLVAVLFLPWRKNATSSRNVPDQARCSPEPHLEWNDEELRRVPYSIEGLRLGMSQEQALAVMAEMPAKRTTSSWAWGPHQMNSALFHDGRLRELRGTRLESCGEIIVRQGQSVESLSVLEIPGQTIENEGATEYQRVYKLPPFEILVSVMNENAMLSLEHKVIVGTDEVKDKIFQITLRYEKTQPSSHI